MAVVEKVVPGFETLRGGAKSIYLAGFDVFRPDAAAYGEHLKMLCSKYGYEGCHPCDLQVPRKLPPQEQARWICRNNLALLKECDLVVANLNAFRGAEPDSGTVFEVGYAVALGIPVWGYTSRKRTLVEELGVQRLPGGRGHVDSLGYSIEDFGLNLNLMIACSINVVIGTVEDCLHEIDAAEIERRPHRGGG